MLYWGFWDSCLQGMIERVGGVLFMIRTLGVTANHEMVQDFSLEELTEGLFEWYWVDISNPTIDEQNLLGDYFKFHPLAIEDCLHDLQRPKLDNYDHHTFFVLHTYNEKTMEAEELDVFVGGNYVVTFHYDEMHELDEAHDRLLHSSKSWKRGSMQALYQIIDKVVDHYFPIIYKIEDYLNIVEDDMSRHNDQFSMHRVFEIRSDLLHLRRTINPMRDLLYRMLASTRMNFSQEERTYFEDIYDHLIKLSEMIDSNRELTSDIRDSNMSMNSSRMNRIMMTLTIVSTVFIPLTFIAGVYGMNFSNMPELEWQFGYYVVLLFMFTTAAGMLSWFAYKGWFQLFRNK